MVPKLFVPYVLYGLGFLVTWSAAVLDSATRNAIDDVVETGMNCKNIPGLSLAIVKDGQVQYSRGYGVKDLDTGEPVTPDTQFLIASLTKAFTATLLTNVVAGDSTKKMSTNVYRVMPGRFKFNNTLRSVYATMEDLVAHRTGIPRNNYVRLREDYSIHSFASKIKYLPHVGGFRDSYKYNDILFGLAARITEELGQQPWKQQMQRTIFGPLGMTRSTFIDDVNFQTADVAQPYVRESRQTVRASIPFIQHWGKNYGSGNIISTANDMTKWMLMLLRDGEDSTGGRVLREGVVRQTFSPQNFIVSSSYAEDYVKPVTPESFTSDMYGLGWKLGLYRGLRMVHHSGSSSGYRAFLTLLPASNVGVVTLMTGSDYRFKFRTALHMYLLDHALGHTPWINSSTICSFPNPWRSSSSRTRRSVTGLDESDSDAEFLAEEDEDELSLSVQRGKRSPCTSCRAALPLRQYVGHFHHFAYGDLDVVYNTSTRSLNLHYGIGRWQLQPASRRHEFVGQWLKDPPTITKKFRFKARGSHVYAVEGIGFEPSKPPVFYL